MAWPAYEVIKAYNQLLATDGCAKANADTVVGERVGGNQHLMITLAITSISAATLIISLGWHSPGWFR